MRFKCKDVEYDFDENRLTVAEARLLKKYTKMGVGELFKGLKGGDPDSMAGIIFLAKFRAGEQPKWSDLDDLDLVNDLDMLVDDEDEPEDDEDQDDEDEGPDPT